jgi:hypothetical protein
MAEKRLSNLNVVSVVPLLSEVIMRIHRNGSVSRLIELSLIFLDLPEFAGKIG